VAIGLGDVVRLSATLHDPRGQEVINTWDVEVTTAGSGGNTGFKEDCQEWIEGLYTTIQGVIHTNAAAHHISFFHRNGVEALTPIGWSVPDFNAAGEELPAGTCGVLFARTAIRRVISKKYIGPSVEAFNEIAVPTANFTNALLGMGTYWIAAFTGANGWHLEAVLWPRTNTGSVALQEVGASEHWAIQRRRRPGRGS